MEKSNIIERVRKLMAMAEDASSPNEAAIAARRARTLMDKFQLDHDDIVEATAEFNETMAGGSRKFVAKWEQWLSIAIGKVNDCQVRYTHDKQFKFQGLAHDVEVCKYMFHYLVRAGKRQCKDYLASQGYTRYNARLGTQWKQGFASEVFSRLQEMAKERNQIRTNSGKELVVMKMALVERHFGVATYGKSKSTWHHDEEASAARENGREAGRRQSVHTGVGSDSSGGTKAVGMS